MILEVCCGSVESVRAAIEGGAQRVELCRELSVGGVTPDDEMIRYAVENGIRAHVLIRCRAGNFVYTPEEVERMCDEIRHVRELGVQGVVIGALTADGEIDTETCRKWCEAAKGLSITFHRAFDECRHPEKALEEIIALGCERLLTSGQAATAEEGTPLLRRLVKQARGRILIMPGAGVSPKNAQRIIEETGAVELHGSLQKKGCTDASMVREVVAIKSD